MSQLLIAIYITSYLVLRSLVRRGVAVEKLAHFKFAKTASRQEAL